MQPFQKPLSVEEETYYIEQSRRGDQEAKNRLIEHNLRLVAHIVKKYYGVEEDPQDLISVGTIGLIKAVNTFDPQKGNRLVTYASRCIENELLMMLRQKKKSSKEVSVYEPIGVDKEGNEIQLLDIVEQEEIDVVEKMELEQMKQKLIKCLFSELNDREQTILILRYGLFGKEEKTQREIGELFHISRSYVSRIEKKSLQKLAQVLQ